MIKKNKVIITGYNGYVGRNLIYFLKKKNIEFKKIKIENIANYKLKNFTHFIHLNFYIKENKKNILKNNREINKVIKICTEKKLFLIFPSTACFKYNKKKRISSNINVINNYTYSKKNCEKEILLSNLKCCILRIFNVYGGDTKNRYYISFIINQFYKKNNLILKFKNNCRDYIHVNDLCNLIYKVIIKNRTGIYEAGSGRNISIQKLVFMIKNIYSRNKTISFIGPNKTKKNWYSLSKIRKTVQTFDWRPKISLKSGLKDLILKKKFLKKNN
jgi:nucleoside-diphosphate-sugar epimerase